jgi:hypothetical protein
LFFNFFLIIKLAPETIKSKKKVGFIFHPYFFVQQDPGSSGFLPPGSGSEMEQWSDPG